MPDFSTRSILPEKMDEPDVVPEEVNKALHELEVVNKWLGGYDVVLGALNKLPLENPITIMDIGCGGGDMLRKIARWAEKKGKKVNLIGVDRNPLMTAYASRTSNEHPAISYITADAFDDVLLNEKADITMNSLFCHHFDNKELISLITRMKQLAKQYVIINDLHRHPVAYYSIQLLTRLFSGSNLVKYDGPLSVARSLTRKEWQSILSQAGINNYQLRWMWAWRWQLIIPK